MPASELLDKQEIFTAEEVKTLRASRDRGAQDVFSALLIADAVSRGLDVRPHPESGSVVTKDATKTIVTALVGHPKLQLTSEGPTFASGDRVADVVINEVLQESALAKTVMRARLAHPRLLSALKSLAPGRRSSQVPLHNVEDQKKGVDAAAARPGGRFSALGLNAAVIEAEKDAHIKRLATEMAAPKFSSIVAKSIAVAMIEVAAIQRLAKRSPASVRLDTQRRLDNIAIQIALLPLAQQPDGRLAFSDGTPEDSALINDILCLPEMQDEVRALRSMNSLERDLASSSERAAARPLPAAQLLAENILPDPGSSRFNAVTIYLSSGADNDTQGLNL